MIFLFRHQDNLRKFCRNGLRRAIGRAIINQDHLHGDAIRLRNQTLLCLAGLMVAVLAHKRKRENVQ
jgi:hypothetical protein